MTTNFRFRSFIENCYMTKVHRTLLQNLHYNATFLSAFGVKSCKTTMLKNKSLGRRRGEEKEKEKKEGYMLLYWMYSMLILASGERERAEKASFDMRIVEGQGDLVQ